MPEALHSGRGVSGQKALALCACLGLLFLAPVCAGATTLSATPGFDPRGVLDRRDVKITLTFKAPQGFETAGGDARLLTSSNSGAEAIAGTFETSEGIAIATFEAQRGGEDKSFPVIELAGQPFALSSSVDVSQIKPRALEVEEIAEDTDERVLAFLARSSIPLEPKTALCSGGLYLKQGSKVLDDLKVEELSSPVTSQGLEVRLAVPRPQVKFADAELVIEVCSGDSARWVYVKELPELSPIQRYALNISVETVRKGIVNVILKPALKGDAEHVETTVLQGSSDLPQLKGNATLSFERKGDSYLSEIPVDCTAGALSLEGLTLRARDPQGFPHLFLQTGRVVVCPRRPWWQFFIDRPVFWSLVVASAVGLMAYIGYLIRGLWKGRHSRRAKPPAPVPPVQPPAPEPSKVAPTAAQSALPSLDVLISLLGEVLQSKLAPIEAGIAELKGDLVDLQRRFPDPRTPSFRKSSWEETEGPAWTGDLSPGGEATNLAELVNRWWRDGADRAQANSLLQSPAINAYRSVNIHDSLRNLTNRTFAFQVTDGPMEWLGRQQQGELWLVPCDPRQFETGDSLKFLGALFDGLGRSLDKVRFRRVVKPCRLQRDPGSQDRYRLIQNGRIELEGQAGGASTALAVQPTALARVPQANPPAPAGMSEAQLARIVQGAIVEAVPRNLTARLEELVRQVGSLQESAPQRAEPTRLDPNLIAAVEDVRKAVNTRDGELRAHAATIQEVKSLVEALRGDLLRIEGGLRRSEPAPQATRGGLFSKAMEVFEINAAVDQIREAPAPPSPPESSLDVAASPWRSTEPVHVPEQVLEKLEKWWPDTLPAAESSPDGDSLPEPSAYLWRLVQTQSVLARVGQQRGWEVSLVHLGAPEGSAQGDASLQITEPVTVSRDYRSASFRGSSFSDALLFQFALSIHGDAGRHIALLPAAGLRVDKHHHAYSRLTQGKLPESAMRLTQVTRPAVLSPAGQSGLYTVASPLKAEFR